MCNEFSNKVTYQKYVDHMALIGVPLSPAPPPSNLQPRDSIRPSDSAPLLRLAEGGEGSELVSLKWGLPPGRPKAPLIINMRGEGRSFAKGRCLVPVSRFYEFTGTKYPKTRWAFSMPDRDWFCLAGLIRDDAFTLLTCEPGPDVQPIHNRQPVVLPQDRWADWLNREVPSAELIAPSPAGTLVVAEAPREKDDEGLLL